MVGVHLGLIAWNYSARFHCPFHRLCKIALLCGCDGHQCQHYCADHGREIVIGEKRDVWISDNQDQLNFWSNSFWNAIFLYLEIFFQSFLCVFLGIYFHDWFHLPFNFILYTCRASRVVRKLAFAFECTWFKSQGCWVSVGEGALLFHGFSTGYGVGFGEIGSEWTLLLFISAKLRHSPLLSIFLLRTRVSNSSRSVAV